MSWINHPTPSVDRVSANISLARRDTQERTRQPLHAEQQYKRLADIMLLLLSIPPTALFLFLLFFLLCFFIRLAPRCLTQNKSQSYISCPPVPPPPPPFLMFFFLLLLSYVCSRHDLFLFCQSPPTIAWRMADREADILSLRGLDPGWNDFHVELLQPSIQIPSLRVQIGLYICRLRIQGASLGYAIKKEEGKREK